MDFIENLYGQWVILQQTKMKIIGPADTPNFVMVEEPLSPWPARPLHKSVFQDAILVDEHYQYNPIKVEDGKVVPFCGCCLSNAGDKKVDVTLDTNVNRWDSQKMAEHLNLFLQEHKIPLRIKENSHGGKLRLSFIASGTAEKCKDESIEKE